MKQYPVEITEAIRLYREKKNTQSRDALRSFICDQCNQMDALLWLAKVTPDQMEAVHAAELAYYLDPENEVAKRAVAGVHDRFKQSPKFEPRIELIKLTGMSQSQAREVNWPFRGLQKPIGVLLEDGTITERDLAWASKNATDPFIRQATKTLLLTSLLEGEVAPSEPARVIQGVSYSKYQIHTTTLNAGVSIGVIIAFVISIVILAVISLFVQTIPGYVFNILSLCLAILSLIFYVFGDRSADKIQNYGDGLKGEEKTLDMLKASLPKPWVLIHNLAWVDRKWGDIDLVLVGPSGVWVLEVKSYSSKMRVSGNRWEYKTRFGWIELKKHPGKQAQRNSMRLRDYLQQKGINPGWVQPVVIWAGDETKIEINDPEIPVWKVSEVQNHVEDFWHQRKLKEDQIQEIANTLETVIENFRAKWK